MYFYASLKDSAILWVGSSVGLPDTETVLQNQALAYGGQPSDYTFQELTQEQYDLAENNMALRPALINGAVVLQGQSLAQLGKTQLANFKRGYIVRKSFTTILNRKISPVWAGV